ncbi:MULTISPECIES: hypothetical protein [unclassified Chryseobacterium]|uniref:hypothetical protein n=1 Tax=unclassified Chryseobacterium TaxID=2593645 RepID=UPI000D3D4946|nr:MULTISPECIES: hypothetical protein [unclassified Chryseobacterium]PTT70993.1 hypothetical protein DBR25_17445 [Chryseobacterium sp. HMWF001]PVV50744.1 hypothetical protein DD829_21305 [Chryseobacterium sp. HMWF035]
MGTRSLTVVVQNHEVKVARYEQSDGYPEALGVTLLRFMKEPTCVEILQETLPKVRLWNQENQKHQDEFLHSIGCENGILNPKQKEEFQKRYPFRYRERFGKLEGGKILELLLEFRNQNEIVTDNDYEFAGNSLFCEWAYVIDFDKNTFEVYKGLNTLGISEEDRFFPLYDGENDYYPVKIKQSFPLDNLPDENKFVFLCKKP